MADDLPPVLRSLNHRILPEPVGHGAQSQGFVELLRRTEHALHRPVLEPHRQQRLETVITSGDTGDD